MNQIIPPPPPPREHVQVAVFNGTAHACIIGRGSFKISPSLKEFGSSILAQGLSRLEIDLEKCIGMDSTFMGMLAGLSQRFRKDGGSIVLTHVSPKIRGLMTTLGLIRLVEIDEPAAPPPPSLLTDLPPDSPTPLQSAQDMLEAHQKLVEIDESNRQRFQDVLDYLREDIQRQQGS